MLKEFRPALILFLLMSLLTGLAYPLAMTSLARLLFPHQASGSFIERNGQTVGSALIGQPFSDPGHFWSRPSATSPMPDNAMASGGSNLGPTNPALTDAVRARADALRKADPDNRTPIPVDLVTASASGLDAETSPAAALWQIPRIARARGIDAQKLRQLVAAHTQDRQFGFLGEARVNVLELNLALDALKCLPRDKSCDLQ